MKITSHTHQLLLCGAAFCLFAGAVPALAAPANSSARPRPLPKKDVLVGTQWELASPIYEGLAKAPVLSFVKGRWNASVGLNGMAGDYKIKGKTLEMSQGISTLMAGPDALMKAESQYATALQSVRSFEVSPDRKMLILSGAQTLTLRAVEPVARQSELAWTKWELATPLYAGVPQAPILDFTDTRWNASVGLNRLSGAYKLDERTIKIFAGISTRMGGPAPVMNAETQYANALQSTNGFALSDGGQTLTLSGAQTLKFRLVGRIPMGFVAESTKIINVAPQLGAEFDGDKTPRYLQLQDLDINGGWGRFTEEKIEGFNFVPGTRYQLRVQVERDQRTGEKRLRLLEILSQSVVETP